MTVTEATFHHPSSSHLPRVCPISNVISPTISYVAEFSRRRSAWHNSRKGRKEAMVYGSVLFVAVIFIDNLLKMV